MDWTKFALAAMLLSAPPSTYALSFSLPATTTGSGKLDLGWHRGGSVLYIEMSGQISLIPGWDTAPDGSLIHPISIPEYQYANDRAPGYPAISGGDGTNHFCGGGANFDVNSGTFGLAGKMTTDTTVSSAIRFGAVVGTFKRNPSRSDWFPIGSSHRVVVPPGGAHLYIAVHDTTYPNNSGSYSGILTVNRKP